MMLGSVGGKEYRTHFPILEVRPSWPVLVAHLSGFCLSVFTTAELAHADSLLSTF